MKGNWKVTKNPMAGYIVARVKDIQKPVHSGNLEYYGAYSDDKKKLLDVADRLNKKAEKMKEKATIYDYARVCKHFDRNCVNCPLDGTNCALSSDISTEEVDEINEIILNWCKEHPVKTRQDKFLEMFPNAETRNGVVALCPKKVEPDFKCCFNSNCDMCYIKYWLTEVEE